MDSGEEPQSKQKSFRHPCVNIKKEMGALSKPFGEGTAEVASLTGLGVAGVTVSSNHESAVGAFITQVEENLSGYLTAEEDKTEEVKI